MNDEKFLILEDLSYTLIVSLIVLWSYPEGSNLLLLFIPALILRWRFNLHPLSSLSLCYSASMSIAYLIMKRLIGAVQWGFLTLMILTFIYAFKMEYKEKTHDQA